MKFLTIKVAARSSPLSKAQVNEIQKLVLPIIFEPIWIETTGDLDRQTSLRNMGKTDFFTREVDEEVITGRCRISIHSAKDLPDPLPEGLIQIALTKGLTDRDALVFREQEPPQKGSIIGCSSLRRESLICKLYPGVICVDLRGNIDKRLEKVFDRTLDGLVVAECALRRLGMTHLNRCILPGETISGQGKLAILARKEDTEIQELLAHLDGL